MAKLRDKIVGYISPKQRKINTLENKVSTLEGVIKDELYNLYLKLELNVIVVILYIFQLMVQMCRFVHIVAIKSIEMIV